MGRPTEANPVPTPDKPAPRWLSILTVITVLGVVPLGLIIGTYSFRQKVATDRVDAVFQPSNADAIAGEGSQSTGSPSSLSASVQDDWSVEYAWSHDVPRGGALTLRLESSGRVTESRQARIGGERVENSRTVDKERLMKALAAAEAAINRFTIAGANHAKADDVPHVGLSLRSGCGELGLDVEDWYRIEPGVAAAVRGVVELSGIPPDLRPSRPTRDRFHPAQGAEWQLTMTVRDAEGRSVEWRVDHDRNLTVHGELDANIVGWYSSTLADAEVLEVLEVSSKLFHEFRFRPKLIGSADSLDVSLSISSNGVTIRTRESYSSPEEFSASGYGTLLKLIAHGRAGAIENRVPAQLLGQPAVLPVTE